MRQRNFRGKKHKNFSKLVHYASVCSVAARSNFYTENLKNAEVGQNRKVNSVW